jgi:serine/threonine protein kinase
MSQEKILISGFVQRLRPKLASWHHLKHPNVTELLGVARLHPERPLGSVTKGGENPNLLTYIGMHPELKLDKVPTISQTGRAAYVLLLTQAKEIVDGIQYLHDQGAIHGDLRVIYSFVSVVQNHLIISQDNVIIADDGKTQISNVSIAQVLDASSFMTLTQSNIRFAAPELMPVRETELSDVRPTRESDIFSLGILLLRVCESTNTLG